MYWDHGYGMGWGWIWVVVVVLLVVSAIAALILIVVRSAASGSSGSASGGQQPGYGAAPPARSDARAIAAERLARGEITPDEYRGIIRALDETSPPAPGT